MIRRNLDFIAIALILFGMAVVQHIPTPRALAEASSIHFQKADLHETCPLQQLLSRF